MENNDVFFSGENKTRLLTADYLMPQLYDVDLIDAFPLRFITQSVFQLFKSPNYQVK